MKFVKITTYYKPFLKDYYKRNSYVKYLDYEQQYQDLMKQGFGWSDFYSKHLNKLGYQATEVVANSRMVKNLYSHVKELKPEIVFFEDASFKEVRAICELPSVKLRIGWYNSPAKLDNYKYFDIVIVGSETFESNFSGKLVYELPCAFEDSIKFPNTDEEDFVFYGSFYRTLHKDRINTVKNINLLKIYGNTGGYINKLFSDKYDKPKYGFEMMKELAKAKIGFNIHGEIAKESCNMRMFETTGLGVCLVTDDLPNKFFGKDEILTYCDYQDCNAIVKWLLEHPKERKEIALNGQKKTLKYHTYKIRANQLDEIIKKNL